VKATAAVLAELNGMPGYPFVVVPHPFGSLDEAAVRSRADAALARIERLLLGGENRSPGVAESPDD
jgi:hypothetical protein